MWNSLCNLKEQKMFLNSHNSEIKTFVGSIWFLLWSNLSLLPSFIHIKGYSVSESVSEPATTDLIPHTCGTKSEFLRLPQSNIRLNKAGSWAPYSFNQTYLASTNLIYPSLGSPSLTKLHSPRYAILGEPIRIWNMCPKQSMELELLALH